MRRAAWRGAGVVCIAPRKRLAMLARCRMCSASSANIARHLRQMADAQPQATALKVPRGRTADGRIDYLSLSFAELDAEVAAWQADFRHRGVQRGDRVLVMVRQGLPLIASVFALFAHGAIPVVIDPGMGRKAFLNCVRRSQPRVLLGIPLARWLSRVFRSAFRSVAVRVPAASAPTARRAAPGDPERTATAVTTGNELAAILFTSGSTGAPKGVCYEHGQFDAQVELIRATYGITPGEVDLPMLPVFALFNPALGMTTVVPEIDPSRPARVDPARIVRAIQQERVTNSFGSPTLWGKIARYCQERRVQLPSLRRVLCAGAPVPPDLWRRMREILPQGELHSPYGATEALPVATIATGEVLGGLAEQALAGAGTCVGRPLPANDVRIVTVREEPIATLAATDALPPGTLGEIVVAGPTVTRSYDQLPQATARAKIASANGEQLFHRMGDAGYLDAHGRLWFCGRLAERVVTAAGPLYTEQVEPVVNAFAEVARCALVGLGPPGQQEPALVVEFRSPNLCRGKAAQREFAARLMLELQGHPFAARVRRVYVHASLPVDVRHNAKIHRLALARWAAGATPVWP